MNKKTIESFIINELSNFKFNRYTKGYKYLVEAIYICLIDIDALDNLTKYVFPKIAKRHKEKSTLHVKWCINQVINTMYNNTKLNIISKYFGLDENLKPSLKLIIYTVVCKYNIYCQ